MDFLFFRTLDDLSDLDYFLDIEICHSITNVKNWIYNFLCQGNADLGRKGKVCPYTKPSIETQNYWIGAVLIDYFDLNEVSNFIQNIIPTYKKLSSNNNSSDVFKCITIVFLGKSMTNENIETLHSINKIHFVEEGLMLGQFYPNCPIRGIHNKEFRPLNSPLPLLVVRKRRLGKKLQTI